MTTKTNSNCPFLLLSLGSIIHTLLLLSCSPADPPLPPFATYKIVAEFPHDENAFTQGLVFSDGFFYESTGRYGSSSLRKIDSVTGEIINFYGLADRFFGEGLAIVGNDIIQLTWKEQTGFVYDKDTFAFKRDFNYPSEGWGLTYDGKQLIMSNGTARLSFLDPETFEIIGHLDVTDKDGAVSNLNELEFIKGEIYANRWKTDHIVRINPVTGRVTGWIDLRGLLRPEDITRPVDVLNGIAYDDRNDRLFVTGKLWPKLFHIELVPLQGGG